MDAAWRWVRDRLWASLDASPASERRESTPTIGDEVDEELARSVYDRLREEFAVEGDRAKSVESKLIAVGSIAPVSVTIILAVVTFLSSGKAHEFTPASVVVLSVSAFYIAMQFLRVILAAIRGLSRMEYLAPTMSAILPAENDNVRNYLAKASNELARRIEQLRETTNKRVEALALAHVSVVNAVGALIVAIVALGIITFAEALK